MVGTTAALILGGLSAAGAIGGAKMSSSAADKAAKTQSDAATAAAELQYKAAAEANALQDKQYQQNRADLAPWRDAGTSALDQLNGYLAPGGPLTQDFAYKDFNPQNWKDPGYDFRMAEGQKAIERSAAARGTVLGGGTLQALTRYAQGTASDEYAKSYDRYNTDYTRAFNTFNANKTNLFNRLSSLAGVGQQTATTMGQLGQNYAGNVGENLTKAAQTGGDYATSAAAARASGYVGSANAWNNAIGNIGNNAQQLYLSTLLHL